MALCRSVAGRIHQGNSVFNYAGVQCTAMAYFAVVTMFTSFYSNTDPSQFNNDVIDNIVIEGNNLYENLIWTNGFNPGQYLAHDELPESISTNMGIVETTIYTDILYGIVGTSVYPTGIGALSLFDAIHTGFQISDYLICTVGDLTIAIVHNTHNYFIFDSHSRNLLGNVNISGNSILLQFSDIDSVTVYLLQMYTGNQLIFHQL